MRRWTEEERRRQAEKIRAWQPWKESTGPKTAAGKAICRRNAVKHGLYSEAGQELLAVLRQHRRFLKDVRTFRRACALEARKITGLKRTMEQKQNVDIKQHLFYKKRMNRVIKEDFNNTAFLCLEFSVACAEDMMTLGALFASAVLPHLPDDSTNNDRRNRPPGFISKYLPEALWNRLKSVPSNTRSPIVRIGLHGDVGAGKTTFVHGMLDGLDDKTVIEKPETDYKWQNLWHSATSGWIRHYDADCTLRHALPSYQTNDLTKCGSQRVDIVEHPEKDYNRGFDHRLFFEADGKSRSVFLCSPAACADQPEFQDFISQGKVWGSVSQTHIGVFKPVVQ